MWTMDLYSGCLFSLPFSTIPSIVEAYLTISEQWALVLMGLFYPQDLVAD